MTDFAALLFASMTAQTNAMAAKYRAMSAEEVRLMALAEYRDAKAAAEAEPREPV